MKRLLTMLLAMCLVVTCLAGCGNGGSTDENGVETVHVWSSSGGSKVVWEKLVENYNSTRGKEKGIKIELTTYGSDYATIVDVARQNGQLPEILDSGYGQTKFLEYIKTDDIIPIANMKGGTEFLEAQNCETIEGKNMIDGKVYDVFVRTTVSGLLYNKDLFKKAGIVDENGEAKPPKTIAEAREYAKKITDKKAGIYGYAFPMKFDWGYLLSSPFAASTGGNTKYDYENITRDYSGWKKPLEWLLAMKKDGSLFPGSESLDNDTARAYFAEGNIGMMAGMSWDVGVLTSQFVASCDWGVAPFPLIDENVKYPAWRTISSGFNLTKTALNGNQEKIMDVFEYLHSKEACLALYENNMELPYNVDYIKDADNSKIIPQFTQFANLVDDTYEIKVTPSIKMEGDSQAVVFSKVFTGEISIDEGIADLTKRATAAFKKGVENGEIDLSLYK